MLEKLRSRYPIDVPAENWGTSWALLLILGGIAGLLVLLPLGGILLGMTAGSAEDLGVAASPFATGMGLKVALGVGTSIAALVFVLVIAGAVGKPGHRRR